MSNEASSAPLASSDAEELTPVDRVIRFVRQSIRDGQLIPGERIVEREIARQLGMGRGSVRDAIQVMIGRGVLTRERQKSPRVRQLTRDEMLDLLEVWRVLGPLAFRLAAERIHIRDNAQRMRNAFSAMRERLTRADHHSHMSASVTYLQALFAIADNDFLQRAAEGMNIDIYHASVLPVALKNRDEYLPWLDRIERTLFESAPAQVAAVYGEFVDFVARIVSASHQESVRLLLNEGRRLF